MTIDISQTLKKTFDSKNQFVLTESVYTIEFASTSVNLSEFEIEELHDKLSKIVVKPAQEQHKILRKSINTQSLQWIRNSNRNWYKGRMYTADYIVRFIQDKLETGDEISTTLIAQLLPKAFRQQISNAFSVIEQEHSNIVAITCHKPKTLKKRNIVKVKNGDELLKVGSIESVDLSALVRSKKLDQQASREQ